LGVLLLFIVIAQCANPRLPTHRPKHCTGECQQGASNMTLMSRVMKLKMKLWDDCFAKGECPRKVQSTGAVACVNGFAGEYPCSNVDLLSFVSLADLGAAGYDGNDIWGWADPDTNKEYAIVGTESGSSFVDVTDPSSPCVLGFLPSTGRVASLWRDIKVFRNYAFIVSEARGHGMQVFDLKQLKSITTCSNKRIFTPTTLYTEFGSAHNLVINEDSGFAYAVGSTTCRAGLHIVNIRNPVQPQFSGCYGDDGYVHDAQCVNYKGPDTRYTDQEVCFCYNEDSLTIVDVTNKAAMTEISRTEYAGSQYTHQGWLLPGEGYLLLNDELDEIYGSNKHTRTMLWDVNDLEKPYLTNSFYNKETVVDHNLYTLANRVYLSNYCGGLRIYDTTAALNGGPLSEIAYFDVAPDCDTPDFFGSWSAYIYFPSKNIVVNSIERGMFTVKFNDPQSKA